MMNTTTPPIGFRFCPTDKELVSYLLKRVKGEPTQIPDIDVYSIEPWRLFSDDDENEEEEEEEEEEDIDDEAATCNNNLTYVFTKIKKKHENGEKIDRTITTSVSKNQVVIGTWKGQQKEIKHMISNEIMGVKKMLSFMPAPSKQDHGDEYNEAGNSKKRKRKQISTKKNNNNIDQLDGISYIMHEYSMDGSSYALCRIRKKIHKSRKMNNKKMKSSSSSSSSSCSRNITRKNSACWDDQGAQEYDQPLQGRMQMTTNTSVLFNHNQSSMLQQHQPFQDAEDDQQQQGRMTYGEMMNAPVLVLDENDSSMRQQQQQQPVQSEAGVTGGSPILSDDEDAAFTQLLEDSLLQNDIITTTTTSTSNGDEDNTTGAGHEEVEEEEDLSNQQQQPPAPTSEGEDSLAILSSIDFESDDFLELGNLYFPSLEPVDDYLVLSPLWS